MSLTITETGLALTETQEGITMPADYSFACINEYVHAWNTNYEDLQYLCLGLASHIEKLQQQLNAINATEHYGCNEPR